MKRWLVLTMAIVLSFSMILAGCSSAENETVPETTRNTQMQTDDSSSSQPDQNPETGDDEKEPEREVTLTEYEFDAWQPEEGTIPVMWIEPNSDSYRMIWNPRNGTISGEELLFSGLEERSIYYLAWMGGNLFAGDDERVTCQPGVAYASGIGYDLFNYGRCWYDIHAHQAFCLTSGGIKQFWAPEIPEGLADVGFDSAPTYLYMDDDERVFAVYQYWEATMVGEEYNPNMKVAYGWASATGEPEGEWSCVDIPNEYAMKMDLIYNVMAYADGKLYIAMQKDILVLDTETGGINCLGLWEKMGTLYEGKDIRSPNVNYRGEHKILGIYGDVLLIDSTVMDEAGTVYRYTIAYQRDEVLGAIGEVSGESQYIIYDSTLSATQSLDGRVSAKYVATLKFPKDH